MSSTTAAPESGYDAAEEFLEHRTPAQRLQTLLHKYPWLSPAVVLVISVIVFSMLGSMGYAPILIFLNERFPTSIRATGTGLSWNIGFAIGGVLPTFVSLASPQPADVPMSLAIFLAVISVIFLIGALIVPETLGKLDEPIKS